MARRLTQTQKNEIRKHASLPMRDIQRKTGFSLAAIHGVLHEPAAAPAAKTTTKAARRPAKASEPLAPPKSRKPGSRPAEPAPAPDDGDPSPVARLTKAVKSLEHAAGVAAADGDQARVIAALRAVSDVTKTIAALTPPAQVNHDERPDMIAAAKAFREKTFALLERVIAETSS
jgi:hypothetical protein